LFGLLVLGFVDVAILPLADLLEQHIVLDHFVHEVEIKRGINEGFKQYF
jgi:hypothetical protein